MFSVLSSSTHLGGGLIALEAPISSAAVMPNSEGLFELLNVSIVSGDIYMKSSRHKIHQKCRIGSDQGNIFCQGVKPCMRIFPLRYTFPLPAHQDGNRLIVPICYTKCISK